MTTWTDDENGGTVWSEDESGGRAVSAFMETVLDDASAAAARTTLGAASSADLTSHTQNINNPHSVTSDQVAFTQSGTGAIAEAVEEALSRRVDAAQYGTLAQAVTAAASKTLVISTSVSVASSTTIPSTVTLRFERGGKIVPAASVTVTINGPIEAGLWQIFDTSAASSLIDGTAKAPYVHPEWWGAVADGVTNDLPACRQALVFAGQAGLKFLFAYGDYAFTTSDLAGGTRYQLYVLHDDVTIEWGPKARVLSSVASARVLVAIGGAKVGGIGSLESNENRDATRYDLTGTQTKGQNTVTVDTAADAANFEAGDIIYIASGQLISGSADREPDSELNEVLSADDTTGVITLRWPLTKTYQAENYNSGSTGVTSVGGGGDAAPYYVANVTDRTLKNIELVNPRFVCGSTALQVVSVWQCFGFRLTGGDSTYPILFLGGRDCRFANISKTRVYRNSDGSTARYSFAPSTGCANWVVEDNEIVADTGDAYLHAHEGVAQTRFARNRVLMANAASGLKAVEVTTRAYDLEIEDNTIIHNCSTADQSSILIDSSCTGGGSVARNRIIAGNGSCNIRIDADGWRGLETNVIMGGGRFSLRAPSQVGKGVQTATQVLSGWVIGTSGSQQLTPTLGTIPRHAIPLRVTCYVLTAFNSDGTDTIVVGYSGTTNAYGTSIDVSTTGVKTVTGGAALLIPEASADRAVLATYAAGGSAPTTGRAFITVEFAVGPRND